VAVPWGSTATLTQERLGKGLAGLGSEGLGCLVCEVGVVLGCFPSQGVAVDNQGSRALKTCFTRGFTAETFF